MYTGKHRSAAPYDWRANPDKSHRALRMQNDVLLHSQAFDAFDLG